MSNEAQVKKLTDTMAQFVGFTAKKLPDDVIAKLDELRQKEDSPMAKVIYDTMFRNQELTVKLNRPSCQDTGVLQFWVKCGTKFPLIDELEPLLKEAVVKATFDTPLRHNSVETFDEYNTGKNVGKGTLTVWWDIVPNSDQCEIYTYMTGGGCTLPGNATVLSAIEASTGGCLKAVQTSVTEMKTKNRENDGITPFSRLSKSGEYRTRTCDPFRVMQMLSPLS